MRTLISHEMILDSLMVLEEAEEGTDAPVDDEYAPAQPRSIKGHRIMHTPRHMVDSIPTSYGATLFQLHMARPYYTCHRWGTPRHMGRSS